MFLFNIIVFIFELGVFLFLICVIGIAVISGFIKFIESDWAKENLDVDQLNEDFNSWCEKTIEKLNIFLTKLFRIQKYLKGEKK